MCLRASARRNPQNVQAEPSCARVLREDALAVGEPLSALVSSPRSDEDSLARPDLFASHARPLDLVLLIDEDTIERARYPGLDAKANSHLLTGRAGRSRSRRWSSRGVNGSGAGPRRAVGGWHVCVDNELRVDPTPARRGPKMSTSTAPRVTRSWQCTRSRPGRRGRGRRRQRHCERADWKRSA